MSEITWYGHSAFKISAPQAHVVIDPFFTPSSGVNAESLGSVDMVLVTHDHGDHVGESVKICRKTGAMLGAIVGTADKLMEAGVPQAQILNGIGFNMGGTMECKGIKATMTQAFHSSDSGAPAGYIIEMPDGLVVYHAGDTCIFSGMELWGQLYHIDVALQHHGRGILGTGRCGLANDDVVDLILVHIEAALLGKRNQEIADALLVARPTGDRADLLKEMEQLGGLVTGNLVVHGASLAQLVRQ